MTQTTQTTHDERLTAKARLSRDLRQAASTLSDHEARYLVDAYYQMQADRIRSDHRIKALLRDESEEPHGVISWLSDQSANLEMQIRGALDRYSGAHPVGRWMRSIKGIGPVISAGYLSGINMTLPRMQTAGAVWAHCGVSPGKDRRIAGVKLSDPVHGYNMRMKRLTWIVGQSFKRLSPDDPEAFYRHIYDKRKAYETAKNEKGDYAEQAAAVLKAKKIDKKTPTYATYASGKLPAAHIDARACRYTAKIFLSHLHHVWWCHLHPGEQPPKPWIMAHGGHTKYIPAPNWPFVE